MNESSAHGPIFTDVFAEQVGKASIAVKECLDVAGRVTGSGSRALALAPAAKQDSAVVARLRHTGWAIVARTNMHELAYGVTGLNAWTGTPINPFYPRLVPGGSSSGSAAAVAAGLVSCAIGTDTGGSIRVPAACCGVVGFKPSFGRVSRAGALPAESTLDCIGPIASDVATVDRVMADLAADWQHGVESPESPRLGWFAPPAETAILKVVRHAAEAAFALVDVELADFEVASDAGLAIIGRETWAAFGHLTKSGMLGRDVHERLLAAQEISDESLEEAEVVRGRFTSEVDRLLDQFDALALPVMGHPVPSLLDAAKDVSPRQMTLATRPFNLSGHPAIALPVGEVDGRPVALQLVGRRGEDEKLCALARRVVLFKKGV